VDKSKPHEVAEGVQKLAEEIETHADAALGGATLERGRAVMHEWVDAMTGFVVNVATGRVDIIHADGRHSNIASPDLPFLLVRPAGPKAGDG
jgi:hypothetical protein